MYTVFRDIHRQNELKLTNISNHVSNALEKSLNVQSQ